MNAIIKSLEEYFGGYNNVKEFTADAETSIDYDSLFEVLSSIYNDNYRKFPYISYSRLYNNVCSAINDIGLEWMTPEGKFTKRLIREVDDLRGVAGIIGDAITRRCIRLTSARWLMSITAEIFWDDGNFGKFGSCWWGTYDESRDCLIDNGGIGILWHRDLDPYNGIGRVWAAPDNTVFKVNYDRTYHDTLTLFNQYGKDLDGRPIRIEAAAQMVAKIFDGKYIQSSFYNDDDGEIPYINGNSGYTILSKDAPLTDGCSIHVNWDAGTGEFCDECGDRIDEDEAYIVDGNYYCDTCYRDLFIVCEKCDNDVWQSDSTYIDHENAWYCDRCIRRYFTYCNGCNEYYRDQDITEIDGHSYCESCVNDNYTLCNECENFIDNSEIVEIECDYYCPECAETVLVN